MCSVPGLPWGRPKQPQDCGRPPHPIPQPLGRSSPSRSEGDGGQADIITAQGAWLTLIEALWLGGVWEGLGPGLQTLPSIVLTQRRHAACLPATQEELLPGPPLGYPCTKDTLCSALFTPQLHPDQLWCPQDLCRSQEKDCWHITAGPGAGTTGAKPGCCWSTQSKAGWMPSLTQSSVAQALHVCQPQKVLLSRG